MAPESFCFRILWSNAGPRLNQVLHRQHLRRKFGLEHGTCCSFTLDALASCRVYRLI